MKFIRIILVIFVVIFGGSFLMFIIQPFPPDETLLSGIITLISIVCLILVNIKIKRNDAIRIQRIRDEVDNMDLSKGTSIAVPTPTKSAPNYAPSYNRLPQYNTKPRDQLQKPVVISNQYGYLELKPSYTYGVTIKKEFLIDGRWIEIKNGVDNYLFAVEVDPF